MTIEVLGLTLEKKFDFSCQDKLILKGNFIKLSDVNEKIRGCNSKSVEIFALKKLFIDEDFIKVGREMNLTMISPTWEIIGERKIDLSGSNGEPHYPSKASNGEEPGSNGQHGKAGLPGGPGGNFFGIGKTFLNGHLLSIIANGGNGGPGQDGGDGKRGADGKSPASEDYENRYICECEHRDVVERCRDPKNNFYCSCECSEYRHYYISNFYTDYFVKGTEGVPGGNGGDGGFSGRGGLSGSIRLIDLKLDSRVNKYSSNGNSGKSGNGGKGLEGGRHGNQVLIRYESLHILHSTESWKMISEDSLGVARAGKNGQSGSSSSNLRSPLLSANFLNKAKILMIL